MMLSLKTCCIRNFRETDAASLAEQANNRRVWLHLRDFFPHPYTLEDGQAYLARVLQQTVSTSFAIEVDGRAVGGISLHLRGDVHRRGAEIGYWIGEDYWNRGIMSEALVAFTDHAFAAFDLLRVHAEPFSGNPASGRVLEKAGYILEGVMRKSVVKDGQVLDQFLYARTQ